MDLHLEMNTTLVHTNTYRLLFVITPRHFPRGLLTNGTSIVIKMLFATSTCLWITMVGSIFSVLDNDYFTCINLLPINPPQGKIQRK